MFIIGLTGSFGSGKSTVARMFKAFGAKVIDADQLMHSFLSPGGKAEKKVAKVFGHGILQSNKINRSVLAKIVFQDPRELKKLTDILYPIGLKEVKKQIAQYKRAKLVILDVPLLFESGWDKLSNINIVVKSNQKIQINRIQKRLALSKADILRRMKFQMPILEKLHKADMVVDNRGSFNETNAQVKAIVNRVLKRNN